MPGDRSARRFLFVPLVASLLVVFFAHIGSIGTFGMVGLLAGPLAVATFLTLLRMYRRDFIS